MTEHRDETEGRIGLFRSWRALYVSVIIYTVGLILLLYLATRLLDFGAP
ncbi:MAG: hypothetical protein OXI39_12690 [Gemmatimonadota bacterium]|nr:hypothetical protein [Candidatus Palauibacter scopulicola]MDE2663846.1 hypothetical protein [Candidatus Palauibacter scopulicola]